MPSALALSTASPSRPAERLVGNHNRPMPYMYILQCSDDSFYTGSTRNLEARLYHHQNGLVEGYTSRRLPVRLVYSAYFARIEDAYAAEKQVQGWSRAKRIALIEGRFEDLPALSRTAKPKPGDD